MSDPYTRSAPFYNPIVEPWLRPIKKKIVQECLRLNLRSVLDVGCGTGTLVELMRKEGIQAMGLDPSPGMIRVSRGNSWGPFFLVRGRGERLPFPSGTFQGLVYSMVLHENSPIRRKEMLAEALRVLSPGGTLFILDYQKPSTPLGHSARRIEYLVEWAVGGAHFRNYRQFMQEGALPAILSHFPPDRVHWEPVFCGSMSLAKIFMEP